MTYLIDNLSLLGKFIAHGGYPTAMLPIIARAPN